MHLLPIASNDDYDVEQDFDTKSRAKVLCHSKHIPYHWSLKKMETAHLLVPIFKAIREEFKLTNGDSVQVKLCKDSAIRIVKIHPSLQGKLDTDSWLKAI